MQEFIPSRFGTIARHRREGRANDFIRIRLGQTSKTRHEFQITQATEQRRDERLNRNKRTVAGATVVPRFEIMRQREMPIRCRACFVFVEAKTHDCFRFALRRSPIQISRRIVNRIRASDDERIHFAFVERLSKLDDARRNHGRSFDEFNGLTDGAELVVDGCHQKMHCHRLTNASHDE